MCSSSDHWFILRCRSLGSWSIWVQSETVEIFSASMSWFVSVLEAVCLFVPVRIRVVWHSSSWHDNSVRKIEPVTLIALCELRMRRNHNQCMEILIWENRKPEAQSSLGIVLWRSVSCDISAGVMMDDIRYGNEKWSDIIIVTDVKVCHEFYCDKFWRHECFWKSLLLTKAAFIWSKIQ